MLQTEDSFSNTIRERELKPRKKPSAKTSELTTDVHPLFECSVPGCTEAFDSFSDLELHLDVGQHNNKQLPSESVYDRVRRDYAAKFASVDLAQNVTSRVTLPSSSETPNRQPLEMGWAISKAHTASTRFSKKVKDYLTGKFVIGERTGRKADPAQVEKDMRTARNPSNERQFSCTEWLIKTSDTGLLLPSCCVATQRTGLAWYVSVKRRRCRMSCKRYRVTGIT